MGGALALDPCRTVRRSTLVIFVPAVLDPLINAATHIEQSKRIWLEAADLDWLLSGRDVSAILAIGHSGLKLIAPPVLCLRSSARCIFPFSFSRESVGFSSGFREPRNVLPGVGPTYIRDGRVVLSSRHERTCLCSRAFIPFPYGDRKFADGKRLDRYLMNRLFRIVFNATHREATAP